MSKNGRINNLSHSKIEGAVIQKIQKFAEIFLRLMISA